MEILLYWLISTLVVLATAYILPGVSISGFFVGLVVVLVLGAVNAVIKPILIILTLPINILTFGLLTFVINALLVLLVARIVPGFQVSSFWWALLFSVIVSVINWVFLRIK